MAGNSMVLHPQALRRRITVLVVAALFLVVLIASFRRLTQDPNRALREKVEASVSAIHNLDVTYGIKWDWVQPAPKNVILRSQVHYVIQGNSRKVWEQSAIVGDGPLVALEVAMFDGRNTRKRSPTGAEQVQPGPDVSTNGRGRTGYQDYIGLNNTPETRSHSDTNIVEYLKKPHVRVAPERVTFDGHSCYVASETIGKATTSERLIAPDLGYLVLRAALYSFQGGERSVLFYETHALDVRQVAPGIFLPFKIEGRQYDDDAKLVSIMTMQVTEPDGLKVNRNLPSDYFSTVTPAEMKGLDPQVNCPVPRHTPPEGSAGGSKPDNLDP